MFKMIIFGEVDFYPILYLGKIFHIEFCPKKVCSTAQISWHPFWYKSTHVKIKLGQVLHFIHNLNDSTTIVYCLLEPNVTVLFSWQQFGVAYG